jgi:hypothetical protein
LRLYRFKADKSSTNILLEAYDFRLYVLEANSDFADRFLDEARNLVYTLFQLIQSPILLIITFCALPRQRRERDNRVPEVGFRYHAICLRGSRNLGRCRLWFWCRSWSRCRSRFRFGRNIYNRFRRRRGRLLGPRGCRWSDCRGCGPCKSWDRVNDEGEDGKKCRHDCGFGV